MPDYVDIAQNIAQQLGVQPYDEKMNALALALLKQQLSQNVEKPSLKERAAGLLGGLLASILAGALGGKQLAGYTMLGAVKATEDDWKQKMQAYQQAQAQKAKLAQMLLSNTLQGMLLRSKLWYDLMKEAAIKGMNAAEKQETRQQLASLLNALDKEGPAIMYKPNRLLKYTLLLSQISPPTAKYFTESYRLMLDNAFKLNQLEAQKQHWLRQDKAALIKAMNQKSNDPYFKAAINVTKNLAYDPDEFFNIFPEIYKKLKEFGQGTARQEQPPVQPTTPIPQPQRSPVLEMFKELLGGP